MQGEPCKTSITPTPLFIRRGFRPLPKAFAPSGFAMFFYSNERNEEQ